MVQHVLLGERAEDAQLAERLRDARDVLEVLCGTWPHVFMSHAHAVLAAFGDGYSGGGRLPPRARGQNRRSESGQEREEDEGGADHQA